jgi:uncharacterized protein YndB with AHSA1/START domain
METMTTPITVQTIVKSPVKKVWESWTAPQHITKWCQASEDWHAPYAENDIRTGGKFKTTMAAKDGSVSFDFGGTYSRVQDNSLIEYSIEDGRKVKITFESQGSQTRVVEMFEPENTNSIELQRDGWQAILESFKNYTESLK